MKQLHPAIRSGLIYACAHQAFALCGLAVMWLSFDVSALFGVFLLLADLPTFALSSGFGNWPLTFANAFREYLPSDGRWFAEAILIVLTLGALQWFAIGCVVALRQERRLRRSR